MSHPYDEKRYLENLRELTRAAIESLTPEQIREIASEVAAEIGEVYYEDDWYDRGERGQP